MSVVPTIRQTTDGAAILATWTLAQNQAGNPVSFAGAVERTFQVAGTFGGALVNLVGSLDVSPTTYFVLNDPLTGSISHGAPFIASVREAVNHIRPVVTGGNGTTNLVCTLLLRMGTR